MTRLTFGYSDSEDRVWVRFSGDPAQLWLTRRLAGALLQQLVHCMRDSCPGVLPGDAETPEQRSQRLAVEHEMAVEVMQEKAASPEAQAEAQAAPPLESATESHRFTAFRITAAPAMVSIEASAGSYQRTLQLSRAEAHQFMGAIARRAVGAQWNLEGLPDWLNGAQAR